MRNRDRTGLVYRKNRRYDPQSGQFTQQDPLGIAGGLNVYGYANGDPINFSDPFGLTPCDEEPREQDGCEEDQSFTKREAAVQMTIAVGVGGWGIVFTGTETASGTSYYIGGGSVAGIAFAETPGFLATVGESPTGWVASVDATGGAAMVAGDLSVTFGGEGMEIFSGVGLGNQAYKTRGVGGAAGFSVGYTWQNAPAARSAPASLYAAQDATRVHLSVVYPALRPVGY